MNPNLRTAALVAVAVLLLLASGFSTTYDRGDLSLIEAVLGCFLLLVAVATSLVKMDRHPATALKARVGTTEKRNEPS